MVSVIVATHGHLAEGLLDAAKMLFGTEEKVWTLGFYPGDNTDNLLTQFQDILMETDGEEVLILTDILGGSPYNVAARLAMEAKCTDVISGINLPLLIEVLQNRMNMSLNELVPHIVSQAADTVTALSAKLNENLDGIQEEEL